MHMECVVHRLRLCIYQICEGKGGIEGWKVRAE